MTGLGSALIAFPGRSICTVTYLSRRSNKTETFLCEERASRILSLFTQRAYLRKLYDRIDAIRTRVEYFDKLAWSKHAEAQLSLSTNR